MKVSEVVAELTGHQPDGHVVVSEVDSMNMFVVESVMKEEDKLPLLMVRPVGRKQNHRLSWRLRGLVSPTKFPEFIIRIRFFAQKRKPS
jgi:hypothetical protein